ncbi:MAG: hypothetical protein AAFY63_13060 [Cyanobacteria bacterium J06643_13]
MLTINKIRTEEHDDRWKAFTDEFHKIKCDKEMENEIYQQILLGIEKIEKIEEILKLDLIQSIPDIQTKLVFELDKTRINVSFEFIEYLLSQENLEPKQKVEEFYLGIDCMSFVLLYYGEALLSLESAETIYLIKRSREYIDIWQHINQSINDSDIIVLHESSLRLIYASLYILEDAYRYIVGSKGLKQNQQRDINFQKEDQIYDSLLADMEKSSQEEWSQEELKAYEQAMSNL